MDASLVEMEFVWPKTPLSAPIRKLSNKLDSALLALTGPEWRSGIKDNSLRASIRHSDEARKNVMKSEFQSLIEKATTQCNEFEAMMTFSLAQRSLDKDSSIANYINVARTLSVISSILEHRSTVGLYCDLALEEAPLHQHIALICIWGIGEWVGGRLVVRNVSDLRAWRSC